MKCIRYLCVLFILLYLPLSYAAIPNNDKPNTFLGPTLRGGFTSNLTDTSAYSFADEVGVRNLRVSGTVGWDLFVNQRLKFSGEYLWQNIHYPFYTGNAYQGVTQGAVGGAYVYQFNPSPLAPQFGFNAYYSNASTFALNTISTAGVVDTRRIAGSNATGFSPGFSLRAWPGNRTGVELNYDNVRYIMKYEASQHPSGWGASLHIQQMLNPYLELGVVAAVRKPFNNYQAELVWNNVHYAGVWALKLLGAYTVGKHTLPNTYNIGFGADYFLDMQGSTASASETKEAFLAWMAKPAVYMPQVLALADENVA